MSNTMLENPRVRFLQDPKLRANFTDDQLYTLEQFDQLTAPQGREAVHDVEEYAEIKHRFFSLIMPEQKQEAELCFKLAYLKRK
jgi:hypothetical protein